MVKKIGMYYLFESKDIKYCIENIIEIFKEKSIPMVVHSQIIQRAFSKPEGLINFVIGGMVPKTGMLYAFVKLIIAILN